MTRIREEEEGQIVLQGQVIRKLSHLRPQLVLRTKYTGSGSIGETMYHATITVHRSGRFKI